MTLITCALPTLQSRPILWLQLESLCNQRTTHDWELIVCEDFGRADLAAGKNYVQAYADRLKAAGCKRLLYLPVSPMPLLDKWRLIAREASPESRVFLLCASDNYSPPTRIEDSAFNILIEEYDWYDRSGGFFFDIKTGRLGLFKRPSPGVCALFMATRTEPLRDLPDAVIVPGKMPMVDTDVLTQVRKVCGELNWCEDPAYKDGLHTDGLNQISYHRAAMYNQVASLPREPFQPCPQYNLSEIMPQSVSQRLYRLTADIVQERSAVPSYKAPIL